MTDFAAARRHMVDGQIRTADVTDLRILAAMSEVARERFVPPESAGVAYLDLALPVGVEGGRRLLKPMVFAKLIHAANIESGARVLDVGCATGYGAAVLARVAGEVVALEQDEGLANAARAALGSQANVRIAVGPLEQGRPSDGPFDAVVLEGATEEVPQALCRQLKDGGRLVCVLGSGPAAKAMVYLRSGDDIGSRTIFDASAAVLPGFAKAPAFTF